MKKYFGRLFLRWGCALLDFPKATRIYEWLSGNPIIKLTNLDVALLQTTEELKDVYKEYGVKNE